LADHFADGNPTSDYVAVNASANFFAGMIMNAQHGVAAVVFSESFGCFQIGESVNKYGDKVF
jgi:hypothetical protein